MDFIMSLGLADMTNFVDTIKIFCLCVFTYYINFKLINKTIKYSFKKSLIIVIYMIGVAIACKIIKTALGFSYNIIFMILLISIIFKLCIMKRFVYSLLVTIISLGINYSIFSLSVSISVIPTILFNIQKIYVGLILIIILYTIFICIFCNVKRFKKGFTFLIEENKNDYIDLLILNISVMILFCSVIISNYDKLLTRRTVVGLILFSIIMFITIKKSLQLYYKQKIQERETEEMKKDLKNKDKEIEELQKENLELNKKNHSIAHKQKLLEYELKQIESSNLEIGKKKLKDKIENLSKEIQNETISIELTKTKVNEIDNMLKYMQSECIRNKIDFQLQVNGNINHMTNKYIEKEDLEILIADMIKNAIIAINHSENINKSILVRLGLIDGEYSLYIYDTGIEFEIDTLINFGIKPSTTHAKEGGTGMGLMNTFDTLKKYKASLIIDEYGKPVKDNFTKVIKIIFDNKNTYKIVSYRQNEIQQKEEQL